jgi:hypothetical protein
VQLLTSFCNVRLPGRPALGLLETATLEFRALRPSMEVDFLGGLTGVALSDSYVFAAAQTRTPAGTRGPSVLLVWERRDLSLAARYQFDSAADVHSLLHVEGTLYAVSTGTDELFALELRGPRVVSERLIWRPDREGPRQDVNHLNAICSFEGSLFVAGFGPRVGASWADAADGFIANATRDEVIARDLEHPHSLAVVGGHVLYCESGRMAVKVLGGDRGKQIAGYTRGLCAVDTTLFVGSSRGRLVSRSSGLPTLTDDRLGSNRCQVSVLDAITLEVRAVKDLSAYSDEIYDLMPIGGTPAWPLVAPEDEMQFRDAAVAELFARANALASWGQKGASGVAERDAIIGQLQAKLNEQTQWALQSINNVTERDAIIGQLQAKLNEQTQWALQSFNNVQERDRTIESQAKAIALLEVEVGRLQTRLASAVSQRDAVIEELQAAEQRLELLDAITSSTAWSLICGLWRARVFLVPHGSLRERLFVLAKRAARVSRDQSVRAAASKAVARVVNRNFET